MVRCRRPQKPRERSCNVSAMFTRSALYGEHGERNKDIRALVFMLQNLLLILRMRHETGVIP